ncbi:MAG TPA: prolyl oligopeptidase family serine peptidase [Puia sp.]|nr:prolyl oligopeptidase family serine peptidase [Puia sp.]
MRNILSLIIILFTGSTVHAQWNYPSTKMEDSINNYFGKIITDHYRWMEHLDDKSVQDWFKQQAEFSHNILKDISGRDSLFNQFVALDKLQSTSYSGMILIDSFWFYKKRKAGDPVASLYYRKMKQGKEILLFNPMNFKKGHTLNIKNFTPSIHGTNITIETAEGGGEVATIRIMNVATRKFYNDSLAPTLYGVTCWVNDNSFMYTAHTSFKEDAVEFHLNLKSMLHVIGTDRANDLEILSAAKYNQLAIAPEDICYVALDNEEKYLVGFLFTAANELRAYYAPVTTIQNKSIPWKLLFKKEDQVTNFFTHGRDLYMLTYKDAPNYKITQTNIETPDITNAVTIYKEGKNKINDISGTKDFLILTLTDGINSSLVKYNFQTATTESILKDLQGQISVAFSGNKTDSTIIGVTSWNKPYSLYDFNSKTNQYRKSVFNEAIQYPGLENIGVKEVEVASHDGVMIPLSILYNKKTILNGNNSCILTGYGCYGYSYSPYFSAMNLALVNQGVVLAYAHVRGGGEKGENWHLSGYKTTKPNTWKDFIACAEYLIKNGYTTKERLAGTGTSAGGILIGRAITERPDLFAAAVCNVGDANALRSEYGTDGPANSKEYGTEKDSIECMALIEMDALSHVQKGIKYPAVLCATGINDARVAPWQPGKFAGALQNASGSGKPVLLRVDLNNGHFTENRMVTYSNFADQDAFMLWQTGDPGYKLRK